MKFGNLGGGTKICSGVRSGTTILLDRLRELLSAWDVKLGSFGKG